jgi:hypothetical protein
MSPILYFLKDAWIRTHRTALASRCASNLATHLPLSPLIRINISKSKISTHEKMPLFKLCPSSAVDFSHNAMRRLAERLFDGMEDTLEEIYLRKGGMDIKFESSNSF